MNAFHKRIAWSIGLMLLALLLLNYQWLWTRLIPLFHPSVSIYEKPGATAAPAIPARTVQVASLNIKAPVQEAADNTERAFQDALINGVVHYPGTAGPGEYGNDYIFGHSSDFVFSKGHFKTVFAPLPNIKVGAEILLSDAQDHVFIYKVVRTDIVKPDDVSVLDQGGYQKRLLTLQTSYPVGTALKRFVAIAELENDVDPLAGMRVYTNTTLHFSLHYPPSWSVQELGGLTPRTVLTSADVASFITISSDTRTIAIIKKVYAKKAGVTQSFVTLGGENAIQYSSSESPPYEWYVVHNNKVYHLTSSFDTPEVRQAVFSLEFK